MVIFKEVTKLRDIPGLQLVYQPVLITEEPLRKQLNLMQRVPAECLCAGGFVKAILAFCFSRAV